MDLLNFSGCLFHELLNLWTLKLHSCKMHSDLFWTCLLPVSSVLAFLQPLHNPIHILCVTLALTDLSHTILIFFSQNKDSCLFSPFVLWKIFHTCIHVYYLSLNLSISIRVSNLSEAELHVIFKYKQGIDLCKNRWYCSISYSFPINS